jgi:D-alanyl-D-alanine carboxypeptidase/D-alanyl-D-alanine-endopeptidase (penicillin-binding protein 4)
MGRMRAPFLFLRLALALLLAPALVMAQGLPPSVAQALRSAAIPESRFGAVVWEAGKPEAAFTHRAQSAFNPASVMKLVTTYAGLELLGPAHAWKTEVHADGPLANGRLAGNLYLKGFGDPSLTLERVWLLVRELRQRGLVVIEGDLVADASWFDLPPAEPGRFDSDPRRSYNSPPSALLANFNTSVLRLSPNGQGVAISADPLPAGYSLLNQLQAGNGSCSEELRPDVTLQAGNGGQVLVVAGLYPVACGERRFAVNLGEPVPAAAGMFLGLWRESGGSLTGRMIEGTTPSGATLLARQASPPLAAIIRDINKWSNNVMTRQLLLTLGAEKQGAPGTPEKGVQTVRDWLQGKGLVFPELVLENGAGLSRIERISPLSMARLLQAAFRSPLFAELESSLPIVAVDGTLKSRGKANGVAGQAHLKTGTLNGAKSLAGYVVDQQGRRWVVVSFINHANAARGGEAQDALVEWVYRGMPP